MLQLTNCSFYFIVSSIDFVALYFQVNLFIFQLFLFNAFVFKDYLTIIDALDLCCPQVVKSRYATSLRVMATDGGPTGRLF